MSETFSTAGQLFFGDIHIHSAISRCFGPKGDGALDDMYIFLRDAAAMDFCAVTDHDNDLMLHDRWESYKNVTDQFNRPGSFVTLPAYEWTSWSHGHLNVYYLDREAPLFSCTEGNSFFDSSGYTPRELWSSLRQSGVEAMTPPHHVAVTMFRTNWQTRCWILT